jgi:hypothetical protein
VFRKLDSGGGDLMIQPQSSKRLRNQLNVSALPDDYPTGDDTVCRLAPVQQQQVSPITANVDPSQSSS